MTTASELRGIYQVLGNSGVFLVDTRCGTCTCKGFVFRHTCRHIAQARDLARENLERDIADLYR
jgi:hypothetical protein